MLLGVSDATCVLLFVAACGLLWVCGVWWFAVVDNSVGLGDS